MSRREVLITDLRKAYIKGNLRMNNSLSSVQALYEATARSNSSINSNTNISNNSNNMGSVSSKSNSEFINIRSEEDQRLLRQFASTSNMGYVAASKLPVDSLTRLQHWAQLEQVCNEEIRAQPVYRKTSAMALRHVGYSDWQWPFLMNK